MATVPMKLVHIFALRTKRKAILERLQKLGAVDIETTLLDEQTSVCPDGFYKINADESAATFERNASICEQALTVLNDYAPAKKGLIESLSGRLQITEQEFEIAAEKSKDHMQTVYRILELSKQIGEYSAESVRLRAGIAQLEPWQTLDVPLNFSGTKTTAAFIGSIPAMYDYESLTAVLAEKVDFEFGTEIISSVREQTCVVVLCHRSNSEQMEQALRELGFAKPQQATSKLPSAKMADRLARLQKAEENIQETKEKIVSFATSRQDIELTADYFMTRADKYRIIDCAYYTKHTFIIRGYIPESLCETLTVSFENEFGAVVETSDVDTELAPVMLKNNAFVTPAESITTMYSLPTSQDIDPTPVLSFFYYFFFGMMLSDAGYGILLSLGSWFLIKKAKPEAGMRKNLMLFLYCGISTTFWGFMYGSFFGDAIPVLSEFIFGKKIILQPILFDPMKSSVMLLILSMVLGYCQIMAGLGAKFYACLKNGDKAGAYFDAGIWMVELVGLAFIAGGMVIKPLMMVGAVISITAAVGLVLTQGRESKGIMKFFSGLASLYGVTGYVSDLLSFSRLMALGLTTGAMGMVFNLLGKMVGEIKFVGPIFFAIIFLIGHAISFGLSALGAYVHTIRLQYVELFSKFYEGGGRVFKPFSLKSKYTRFKEEK